MDHLICYEDRELLKKLAYEGACLKELIIMISHWARQDFGIPFSVYASHWAEAQDESVFDTSVIRKIWPLREPLRIEKGGSDWRPAV
jgi:hypothetical protein